MVADQPCVVALDNKATRPYDHGHSLLQQLDDHGLGCLVDLISLSSKNPTQKDATERVLLDTKISGNDGRVIFNIIFNINI